MRHEAGTDLHRRWGHQLIVHITLLTPWDRFVYVWTILFLMEYLWLVDVQWLKSRDREEMRENRKNSVTVAGKLRWTTSINPHELNTLAKYYSWSFLSPPSPLPLPSLSPPSQLADTDTDVYEFFLSGDIFLGWPYVLDPPKHVLPLEDGGMKFKILLNHAVFNKTTISQLIPGNPKFLGNIQCWLVDKVLPMWLS